MPLHSDALVLVGAGRMGSALLAGWTKQGIAGRASAVIEPAPSADLVALCARYGISLNPEREQGPAGILVLAIKPQTLDAISPKLKALGGPQTLVVSILAGKSIADLSARLPHAKSIVRAMPNTPASIGQGITGLVASPDVIPTQRQCTERLLKAVGETVWIPDESLMDAVTAVSGSGPAYLFYFTEMLSAAAREAGLPGDLAAQLARKTIEGSAALMAASSADSLSVLRENVTSPGGTTAAALEVFADKAALKTLVRRAVAAAVARGKALSG